MALYVFVWVERGKIVRGGHEHAAPPLQPTLLVGEAEGFHELVNVDGAVTVAVDGHRQF